MKSQIILILLAIAAGAALPFQAGLNIQLGKAAEEPIFAAFASFAIGALALLTYLFVLRFDFAQVSQTSQAPATVWFAGVLGAFYVAAVIMLAPKLGVALTFSLVVAGQMTISLLVDHFGLMGLHVAQINWQRIVGVMLLIGGVILIRKF